MRSGFNSALDTAKKVLALDFACEERDFDEEGVFIHEVREMRGRWRLPFREKSLMAATMGSGVVVGCSAGRLRWTKANLGGLSRENILDISTVARMQNYVTRDTQEMRLELKYICAPDTFKPYVPSEDLEINLVEDVKQLELYNDNRFPNSIGYSNNPQRVAAIARINGEIAGKAGVSADCDIMWQIGVDTLPAYRNRGIGKAMVSAVTEYIFKQGIVPYYSTSIANIASRRIVISLGYRPAWVELYSRELKTKGGS